MGDITYIRTGEDWLYLTVVIDRWSRTVIGWSMSLRMTTQFACNALQMALSQRKRPEQFENPLSADDKQAWEHIQKQVTIQQFMITRPMIGIHMNGSVYAPVADLPVVTTMVEPGCIHLTRFILRGFITSLMSCACASVSAFITFFCFFHYFEHFRNIAAFKAGYQPGVLRQRFRFVA
ncbi:IS3 transposase [Salmonella enterica]|nr:IS3 transposase [Salmonella enterica]